MPILKHRLELEGISHVVSLVSFLDVKAKNNFTSTPNDDGIKEIFCSYFAIYTHL